MCNMKNKRVIQVEVPKEIWDADMSFWNVFFMRKDIMDAWMKSIQEVVKTLNV